MRNNNQSELCIFTILRNEKELDKYSPSPLVYASVTSSATFQGEKGKKLPNILILYLQAKGTLYCNYVIVLIFLNT